jgi:hypothetical protein
VIEKTDPDESGSSPPRPASALRQALRSGAQHSSDNFRGDVAGLRAVAVGLVLLYHGGLSVLPGGFAGVDVSSSSPDSSSPDSCSPRSTVPAAFR